MITHFPIPQPDEWLYSVVIRYHLLSGNRNFTISVKQITGKGVNSIASQFPADLCHVANNISSVVPITGMDILEELTHFPFYRSFLAKNTAEKVAEIMLNEDGKYREMLGMLWLSRTVKVQGLMQFCPYCACEDFKALGYAYWRRSHQLPGVTVCHVHGNNLVCNSDTRYLWGPPRQMMLPATSHCDMQVIFGKPISNRSSELTYALVCNQLLFSKTSYDQERMSSIYRKRLFERGYSLTTDRIDMKRFASDFLERYSDQFLKKLGATINVNEPANTWLAKITRTSQGRTNPVYHVLLISFLFDSLNSFNQAYLHTDTSVKNLQPESDEAKMRERVVFMLKEGRSHVEILKQIPITKNKLCVIADDFKCSYDPAHKLKQKAKWRERISTALSTSPELSRTSVDSNPKMRSAMSWLRRHDAKWLNKMLPSRKGNNGRQIITKNLDLDLASQIPDVVARIKSAEGLPKKITIATLGREFGIHDLYLKLPVLPLTKKVLVKFTDTKEDFEFRKLFWAIKKIKAEGLKYSYRNVLTTARLPDHQTSKNVLALAAQILKNDCHNHGQNFD